MTASSSRVFISEITRVPSCYVRSNTNSRDYYNKRVQLYLAKSKHHNWRDNKNLGSLIIRLGYIKIHVDVHVYIYIYIYIYAKSQLKNTFFHDRPWISPWIKSISNELDITCHVFASSAECKASEWDMGMMCEDPHFSVIYGYVMSCKK